ncbi:MAG: ThiF family adenylyltransferase [Proteobacteria bacterium]|nr:ThiF family adenylyltransferase [Pseudomonadota bacterium]
MSTPVTLALSGDQHAELRRHLFPGDGEEAVAILLCGRRDGDRRHRLVAQRVLGVPYEVCDRTPERVTWPTDAIAHLLDEAAAKGLSVVKVHSHPTGYPRFSETDDTADARLFPAVHGWVEGSLVHASAVMLPGGEMFGRTVAADGSVEPIHLIAVAGDDLHFWFANAGARDLPAFVASHAQAFDEGTIERLRGLTIGVVGVSGTGSPTLEQVVRLGTGVVVPVDDDVMEDRNVNRILNATMADVVATKLKVDVQADAIRLMGLGTTVIPIGKNLWHPEVILAIAQCDILIGCVDTVDGRYLLNTIATHYNIPYFDIGVRLDAVRDGPDKGQIREVCGTINYLQPGRSSLMSRGLFTVSDVAAAGLRRNDPAAHARQVKDGYIKGVQGHRPAVISVNMLAASLAVNELLARLHPYREEPNANFASVTFTLSSMELITEPEAGVCNILKSKVGMGDTTPLLGLLELAERRTA